MQLPAFAMLHQRLNSAVQQRLSNALVQRTPGGPAWAAMYDVALPERSPFADAATVPQHTVSLWLAGLGSLAEGEQIVLTTPQWPAGQPCRITTPVVADASGWATFDVVPLPPAPAPAQAPATP